MTDVGDSIRGSGQGTSAADEEDARIGSIVDRYTIVKRLGRGGMGAVYEARHAHLARRFAIKFLLPALATNREVLRRFENEAKAAGGLEHQNLVAVTDFGRATDGAPYIVMEFLQGEDCSKLLRRTGHLPVPRACDIVLQACRGLAVAHKANIVHRDLKPENLYLADAGDGSDLVKVLDFGIAKLRVTEGSLVTNTGATFGTAHYMSPEQARGAADVDQRTDVWSLGVVLYELLSGRKPFEGDQFLPIIHQILTLEPPPLRTLRPGLPPKLLAAVERAMRKEVKDRPPSVGAFAEAIAQFAGRTTGPRARSSSDRSTAPTPATNAGVASDMSLRSLRAGKWIVIGVASAAVVALGAAAIQKSHHSKDANNSVPTAVAPSSPPAPVKTEPAPAPPSAVPNPRELQSVDPAPAPIKAALAPTAQPSPVEVKPKRVSRHTPPPPSAAPDPPSKPRNWVDPFAEEPGAARHPETKAPASTAPSKAAAPGTPPASQPNPKPKHRLMESL